jgi:hypothetical protein
MGLPPLNLAASGGDAKQDSQTNVTNRYDAAFNVGAGAGGLPPFALWAGLALAGWVLWRNR